MANPKNPLLETVGGLPIFDRIEVEHIEPGLQEMLVSIKASLDSLEKNHQPTWAGLVEQLVELGEQWRPWGVVEHIKSVKDSAPLRAAYEKMLPAVVETSMRVSQSRPLYDGLVALRDSADFNALDAVQKRVIELAIRDANLAGVGLASDARRRFNAIQQRLSSLSTEFENHLLDATKAWSMILEDPADIEGLPPIAIQQAAQSARDAGDNQATNEKGPWRFTLAGPSYVEFMKHSPRRELRERMYRAYLTRASAGDMDNTPLIREMLVLRREMAGLLGFSTYAEQSLATKMAPDVAAIDGLIEELRCACWRPAQKELAELQAFARDQGAPEASAWQHWDTSFWAERMREKKFAYSDEEVRAYLSFDKVLDGLFGLFHTLFGVSVAAADGKTPVWHKDVRYFEIHNAGKPVASFYLDPYARPENKRGGAWMNECVGRSRRFAPVGADLRLPTAYICCNGTPPVNGKPSPMSFNEMETLFHELGHGLQHMLTQVDYDAVAGISNVEWDAVELASQFMENFCYEKNILRSLTAHVDTGEPMPDALIDKIIGGRNHLAATHMLRQLYFAKTDVELYHRYEPTSEKTPFQVQREVAQATQLLQPLPEDRFLCGFSHIFPGGYAAGYYSYKWAEVLSADAFGAFEEAGLDNTVAIGKVGRRFANTVLALGGSRPAMEVFESFRGRKPSIEALLRQRGLST